MLNPQAVLADQDAAWAGDTVSLDEYWRRIDAAADSVAGAGAEAAEIEAAADALATIKAVELPDGQVLPVENSDLVALLRRDQLSQDDFNAVRARLAALQRARDATTDRPALAKDRTFVQLEEILSRPEFSRARRPEAPESPLERIISRLSRTLARWLSRVGALPGMEYLLTILGIALVLVVLAYVFRGAWRQWVAEDWDKSAGTTDDAAGLSSSDALERAHTLAANGAYRQAVRYLYLSALLWLDERHLLHYDPTLTNREHLRQVTGHTALHESLVPIIDIFERVWYGSVPLDSRGFAAYVRRVEQMQQLESGG